MRLLVTGGAGFIGSNYVRMLLDGSLVGVSKLIILDKLTYSGNKSNLKGLNQSDYEFVQGDICDSDLVSKLTKKVDSVVNFAAESHVDRSIDSSKEFFQTNVIGTHTLLEAARRNNLGSFIQISTDEVYGSITEGSWDEGFPLLPNSPYAASKASGDLISQAFFRTYGIDVRITRCSNNYGPYQFPEKVIPLFITNLLKNKKVPLYGDGLNVRDWLHVTDHCRGIHLVLTKGKAGDIFNIGGGRELSNIELTRVILSAMRAGEESIEKVTDRLGHDWRYSLNIERIERELGYKPEINFDLGISQTIEWYKNNEEWWKPVVIQ
jgi:dTDP-glucose 4,6-dehydratase